jgi:hypothetical protein
MAASYPMLDRLMGAYFNQDADYTAETLEGIVAEFRSGSWPAERAALRAEIERFLEEHRDDVDAAFEAAYPSDADPAAWADDTATFLQRIHRMLQD